MVHWGNNIYFFWTSVLKSAGFLSFFSSIANLMSYYVNVQHTFYDPNIEPLWLTPLAMYFLLFFYSSLLLTWGLSSISHLSLWNSTLYTALFLLLYAFISLFNHSLNAVSVYTVFLPLCRYIDLAQPLETFILCKSYAQ